MSCPVAWAMSQPCTSSSSGMISTARLAGSALRPTATEPSSPRCRQAASAASAVAATSCSSGPAAGVSICSPATEASSTMDRTRCRPTSPTVYSAHGVGRERSSSVSRCSTARQAGSVTAAQSNGPIAQAWTCRGLPASSRWASPMASDWVGWGWMSAGHFGREGFPVVDELGFGDQFANAVADDVDAEDRAVLGRDDLDGALGVQDGAAAVAGQVVGDRGDVVRAVLVGCLRLGVADRGDLRMAVGDAGHAGVVDGHDRQSGEVFGHQDALGEADVGQLRVRSVARADKVADRVDALGRGTAVLIDGDEAAFDADALLFVAQPGRHRTAAHGDQQQFGIQRFAAFQVDPDPVVGGFGALEPGAQLEADAAAAEFPLEQLGAGLVFQRDQVRQRLDDGHLAAERGPRRGELAADHPAAEHDRGGRHPVELERVFAGHDPVRRPGPAPAGCASTSRWRAPGSFRCRCPRRPVPSSARPAGPRPPQS